MPLDSRLAQFREAMDWTATLGSIRNSRRAPAVALALLALAVYANTVRYQFAYDDFLLIVENPEIQSLRNVGRLFTTGVLDNFHYRALTRLSFALDYAAVGLQPWLYHAENVLLHAVVTLLVYLALRSLGDRAAWLAAALFAVHPVHTEVVANVASRSELLAAALGLAALAQLDRPLRAGILLFLALLAKEQPVVVPALAVVLWSGRGDRLPIRRLAWTLAALLAAVLAFLLILYLVLGHLSWPRYGLLALDNPLALSDPATRVRTALMILGQNLALCFVPSYLSVDYSYPQIPLVRSWLQTRFLLWSSLLVLSLAGAWLARRAHPNVARGLAWFLVAIGPVSNLLAPIGTIRADRLLYLPSIGACLILAEVLQRLIEERRRLGLALAVILMAALGLAAVQRNGVWRDEATVIHSMAVDAPRSARAPFALAQHYARQGNCRAAIPAFQRSLEILPELWLARFKLAVCLETLGDLRAAQEQYRRLFVENSSNSLFAHRLVRVCERLGDWRSVTNAIRRLMVYNPQEARQAGTWLLLANALLRLGDLDQADTAYRRSLELEGSTLAHFNLAGLLVRRGRFAEAAVEYRAARLMGMESEALYEDWALAARKAGDQAAARAIVARGLERFPASRPLKQLLR